MALELAPKDREAFLAGACPDEVARARLEALLRRHEEERGDADTTASIPPGEVARGFPKEMFVDG